MPKAKHELMRADETASITGFSTFRVYELARLNLIPHKRLGRTVLFPRTAILAWLKTPQPAAVSDRGHREYGAARELRHLARRQVFTHCQSGVQCL
jgi:excisionase family DNA binding protein